MHIGSSPETQETGRGIRSSTLVLCGYLIDASLSTDVVVAQLMLPATDASENINSEANLVLLICFPLPCPCLSTSLNNDRSDVGLLLPAVYHLTVWRLEQ